MNRTTFLFVRAFMCGVILLFTVTTISAQFKAGIQGTVRDATGGLVPQAKVTLTNTETGKSQEVISSDEGFYRISGLPPGKYVLTTEKDGYKKQVLENVAIGAETIQGLDLTLET